ncbi:MAG: hypothetical protein JO053_02115 [Acidobacteria bacterium]|nr:hypothetical protein [Acidobacteriota bacterium]
MQDRFKNILDLLSTTYKNDMAMRRWSPYVISGYSEIAENAYELKIDSHPLGGLDIADNPFKTLKSRTHSIALFFHPPYSEEDLRDDVFTIEFRYLFAGIENMSMDMESAFRQYFALLENNDGSFFGTGSYISIVRSPDGNIHVPLQTMLHFLVEFEDQQVARILSFQLAGMFKGLENWWDDSLTMLRRFE